VLEESILQWTLFSGEAPKTQTEIDALSQRVIDRFAERYQLTRVNHEDGDQSTFSFIDPNGRMVTVTQAMSLGSLLFLTH
jgi:gamma-glutamyltranspeptidase